MNNRLRQLIAEVLGTDEASVTLETDAENEARWDSLRHMNLVFALEDAFGVRFSDDEIPILTSVRNIEAALSKRSAIQ